jgi:Ni,Fe-hydrogenase III large subunit
VRWLEVQRSFAFILDQLASLPTGDTRVSLRPPARGAFALAAVEGWRGAVCHAALTDKKGAFSRY